MTPVLDDGQRRLAELVGLGVVAEVPMAVDESGEGLCLEFAHLAGEFQAAVVGRDRVAGLAGVLAL
ncbi:hypothetical protein [Actinoplanes philippinensis]|uniref:hypothetical protein n=1 Tax=Actinoplanes philippinensis TaxID=35752 RepID=UPI0033E9FF7B